jgi:hypothetical protein
VALQGTLDTFALADVLRLLASTGKTGCLRVSADAGYGNVWVNGGGVVGAEAPGVPVTTEPVEAVFELLRYREGAFAFHADEACPVEREPAALDQVLEAAEGLMAEWSEIEAVIPSMTTWVRLADELPRRKFTVDGPTWRLVVAIGTGATAGEIAAVLEMGEVGVSRSLRGIVDSGLAVVFSETTETEPEAQSVDAAETGFGAGDEEHGISFPDHLAQHLVMPDGSQDPDGESAETDEDSDVDWDQLEWEQAGEEVTEPEPAEEQLDEPVDDEAVVEEPAADEPAADEPAADEPELLASEPVLTDGEGEFEGDEPRGDRGRLVRFLGSVRS